MLLVKREYVTRELCHDSWISWKSAEPALVSGAEVLGDTLCVCSVCLGAFENCRRWGRPYRTLWKQKWGKDGPNSSSGVLKLATIRHDLVRINLIRELRIWQVSWLLWLNDYHTWMIYRGQYVMDVIVGGHLKIVLVLSFPSQSRFKIERTVRLVDMILYPLQTLLKCIQQQWNSLLLLRYCRCRRFPESHTRAEPGYHRGLQ